MNYLADLIVRRPRRVIGAWVLLTLVGLGLAGGLSDRLANRGFEVSGSDSDEAQQVKERELPSGEGTQLFLALTSERPDRAGLAREAGRVRNDLQGEDDVGRTSPPVIARDGRAAVVPVLVDLPGPEAERRIPDLEEAVGSDRFEARILGEQAVSARYTEIAREDLERAEKLSFPAPMLLLLLAFLSVVAAGLPIVSGIVTLGVTFGALFAVTEVADMSVFATNTAVVLGIGLSIDFALFMVMRFRELNGGGASTEEAIRGIVATTGRAILTSAVTIGASLAALFVVGVGLFTSMAIGAMLATFVAALTSLTLIPAVLMRLGPRIDRWSLKRASQAASEARLWYRLGGLVVRRPALLAGAVAVVLLAMSVPLLMADLTVRSLQVLPEDDPVRVQSDRVARSFGQGTLAPAEIVTRDPARAERAIGSVDGFRAALPPVKGSDGWSRVDAILAHEPDSREAETAVTRLRDELGREGVAAHVGGPTAANLDLTRRIEDRTPAVVIIALLTAAVALAVGFRSLLVPLKAVLTTALSVGAALGLVVLAFQIVGSEPGLGYFVPLLLFSIVFGLSMDYEVFLLSRVREEYLASGDNDGAVREALVRTGRSITLAAGVMITVFLIFALSSLVPFQELGIGLAVAVLLDATLVRAILVPAALALLGDLNWWLPRRRARVREAR